MELRAMHKCAVFVLAVIACCISHLVFSVEGRQIKSGSESVDSATHKEVRYHHHQPGAPGSILNATQKQTKSSDFGDSVSVTRFDDDFRPTTPGNSPGVGHSFAQDDEYVERKPGSIGLTNDEHSVGGDKEDFRRTSPGHSPGVGHVFPSNYSEPNVETCKCSPYRVI